MTIIHILPFDQPRGAQLYARALADYLDSPDEHHLVLTIFRSESATVGADLALDVPQGLFRRLGLDPRALWRLRRELTRARPDIVVAHGGESAKYAALASPRTVALVYLSIGAAHPSLRRFPSRVLRRFYTLRANLVVAVSGAVSDELGLVRGLSTDRVVVIPNGRDSRIYFPAPESRTNRPRIIWIGQLDWSKRPEWFLNLADNLAKAGYDFDAVMVGDGPRREELTSLAEDAGVSMLGHRDDVPKLLADSDILVFTGRPPEGMPGVLIEAGLCGLPSVSTRVPGAADVVDDGVTGVLVDVGDERGLLLAVEALLLDDEERGSMGRRARQRCLRQFTLQASGSQWREVFEQLRTAPEPHLSRFDDPRVSRHRDSR